MAQPSGQLALKTANASEYFWYAQGTGVFDAKNNAMLTKTGSAGMSTESGVNVALGNSSTTYALGSAINLASPWTLIVRCRVGASAGTQAMICGDTTGTGNYVWLRQDSGAVICKINGDGAGKTSTVTALSTWAFVFSGGTLTTYKDGTSLGTESIPNASLKINTLLGGYSGGSFVFNGAFECANVIPSALSAGDISTRTADLYAVLESGGASATTTISATLGAITGSISSVSAPKTTISATLANVSASVGSTAGTLTTTITATLANIAGAITSTGSTANGTFTSEVLKDYAGNVLASVSLNYVRFYNDTTGALVLNKTGVSTNGSGIVTLSDATLVAGTTYRVDWETAAGSRRMPRKAAS